MRGYFPGHSPAQCYKNQAVNAMFLQDQIILKGNLPHWFDTSHGLIYRAFERCCAFYLVVTRTLYPPFSGQKTTLPGIHN